MLFGTISYSPIIFGNNLINIFNTIINIFYYFVPSTLLMIVYKYEVLSINEKESNFKVPEIVTFVFQIIINLFMTIGLGPVTGIPLPFMSYGRTSLVTNFISIGFVLSILKRSRSLRS